MSDMLMRRSLRSSGRTRAATFCGRLLDLRRLALLVPAFALVALVPPAAAQAQSVDSDRLWILFMAATEDQSAIGPGLSEIRGIRSSGPFAGEGAVLDAFEGAFLAMSATTTAWPPSKLSRALDGLSLLDRAVRADPRDPTVRYLRLVICHHVPGLFRRGATARADANALADMLLDQPSASRTGREREMAAFLLATDYLPATAESSLRGVFPGS